MTASQAAADPTNAIAFQGVPGANSHIACREAYPEMEPVPCDTFEEAFACVEDGRAALAMIPIENSLGGRVADIHHLLPDSSLAMIAEHFMQVKYHLLGVPGAHLDGVKQVWSHVQALAQCREQIKALDVEPVARADTAGAAREVAELADPAIAAVSPPLAAEIYGLDVLRQRFEDHLGNVTRFVVMSRQRRDPDPRDGKCMTAFIFQVRSVPASLYKAMGGFATNGVNITKLESYITGEHFTVARFYAEIEGHPSELHVARAFEELEYFSTKLRILGVFQAHAHRDS